jgi:hypothetical protein
VFDSKDLSLVSMGRASAGGHRSYNDAASRLSPYSEQPAESAPNHLLRPFRKHVRQGRAFEWYDSVRRGRSILVFLTVFATKARFLNSRRFVLLVMYDCSKQSCTVLVCSPLGPAASPDVLRTFEIRERNSKAEKQ